MKFGQHLARACVKEWAEHYVDYDHLKKMLYDFDTGVGCKDWEDAFWTDAGRVSTWYQFVVGQLDARITKLQAESVALCEASTTENPNPSNEVRIAQLDTVTSLVEVLEDLERLHNFAALNFTALQKILRKLEVKQSASPDADWRLDIKQLHVKLEQQPFHHNSDLTELHVRAENLDTDLDGLAEMHYLETHTGHAVHVMLLCYWLGFLTMGVISSAVLMSIDASEHYYTTPQFMSAIPIFRLIFMLILLLWIVGFAVSFFEHYKINYILLLGIHPSCPIDSSLAFRFAAILSGAWLLVFWCFLADFKFGVLFGLGETSLIVYPLILLVVIAVLACSEHTTGLEMIYKKDVLKCFGGVLMAPFMEVTFASVVMGDILTSFTRPLKDLVYSSCYFFEVVWYSLGGGEGTFSQEVKSCKTIDTMWACSLVMACPYYFRFMQCLRRYRDQPNDKQHLCNAGKYLSCMTITGVALLAPHSVYWVLSYCVATTYCAVWDYKMDWGLELQNKLHRDHETYPRMLYLIFALLNLLMRLTWAFATLTPSDSSNVSLEIVFFVFSAIEVYRRGQWSVIRLENEHLKNPSKFRVTDWVPPLVPVQKTKKSPSTAFGPLQIPLLGSKDGIGKKTGDRDTPKLPHHAPQSVHALPPRANAMSKGSRITSAK